VHIGGASHANMLREEGGANGIPFRREAVQGAHVPVDPGEGRVHLTLMFRAVEVAVARHPHVRGEGAGCTVVEGQAIVSMLRDDLHFVSFAWVHLLDGWAGDLIQRLVDVVVDVEPIGRLPGPRERGFVLEARIKIPVDGILRLSELGTERRLIDGGDKAGHDAAVVDDFRPDLQRSPHRGFVVSDNGSVGVNVESHSVHSLSFAWVHLLDEPVRDLIQGK